MSIKAGEKIINGNMIKRNEELKIKEQNAKKTVYLIKAISGLWGRGGQTHRKKIITSKKKIFFKFPKS